MAIASDGIFRFGSSSCEGDVGQLQAEATAQWTKPKHCTHRKAGGVAVNRMPEMQKSDMQASPTPDVPAASPTFAQAEGFLFASPAIVQAPESEDTESSNSTDRSEEDSEAVSSVQDELQHIASLMLSGSCGAVQAVTAECPEAIGLGCSDTIEALPDVVSDNSFRHEQLLKQLTELVEQDMFTKAVRECLEVLETSSECLLCAPCDAQITRLIRDACNAWESSEPERARLRQDEVEALKAQIQDARALCENLREAKQSKDMQLVAETRRRAEAEADLATLQQLNSNYNDVVSQNAKLRSEVQSLRNLITSFKETPSLDEVIQQLASLECEPLRHSTLRDRAVQKKKLLLKWHPDKQPSIAHASLATQVLQELQNNPEW